MAQNPNIATRNCEGAGASDSMDRAEFLKQEYITLREEIRETKDRIFKTLSFGLVVVPASNFLGQAYQIDAVILSLPILVLVVALLYLAEQTSAMRCGRYIKHHIEPHVAGIVGWEHWLEQRGRDWDARSVDKYLSYAFYLIFLVYFVGSVFVSGRFAINTYGIIQGAIILSVYIAVGLWFVIYLIYALPMSTGVDGDPAHGGVEPRAHGGVEPRA